MNLEIIVLGSGNAFNTDGRGHAAFYIKNDATSFLVDCGPTILLKAASLKIDLKNLTCVYLTHFHGDHLSGLPFLLLFMKYIENRKRPFTIIGPIGIKQAVNYVIESTYPEVEFPFKVFYEEIGFGVSKSLYYVNVETVNMDHREESIGYRFTINNKTIAFSGDTKWTKAILSLARECDIAFIECTTEFISDGAHTSLEEIMENPDDDYLSGAKLVVLTHLTNKLSKLISNSTLKHIPAYDGLKFNFNT